MGSKCRFYFDIQTLNSGVTGSCHLCIVKYPDGSNTRFIVDCGLFQGKDDSNNENKTFPFDANNIDFALITHNHVDHVGRLPLLYKNGFRGKIYATADTCTLLPLALYDSYRVLKHTCKRAHEALLYSDTDVSDTLSLIKPVFYEQTLAIDDNINVTFLRNGHLVGAAVVLVQISYPDEEPINWLFTGDYNNKNMFFDVPTIPIWVLNLPLNVMQESTYGNMDSSEIIPCFKDNLLRAVENQATIVIPVFSLGRSQEVLYVLRKLQEDELLSKDVPIYFDGNLAHAYTKLYLDNKLDLRQDMVDFLPYNLEYVDSSIRDYVLELVEPKIILTTSGMGSYGPAPLYISNFIKQKNALIQFTGYTAEGTMGYELKTAESGSIVKIGGLIAKKLAKVEYTTEFSAHAKADEMIEFLKQFKNLHLVLINHGEGETKEAFADRVLREVDAKDVGIANRDLFFRVSSYHLIKTLTTKFQ